MNFVKLLALVAYPAFIVFLTLVLILSLVLLLLPLWNHWAETCRKRRSAKLAEEFETATRILVVEIETYLIKALDE